MHRQKNICKSKACRIYKYSYNKAIIIIIKKHGSNQGESHKWEKQTPVGKVGKSLGLH